MATVKELGLEKLQHLNTVVSLWIDVHLARLTKLGDVCCPVPYI